METVKNTKTYDSIKRCMPLIVCAAIYGILVFMQTSKTLVISELVFALSHLSIAISFPYVVIKEAEILRKKGKYKTVYSATLGAGAIGFSFLTSAVESFIRYLYF